MPQYYPENHPVTELLERNDLLIEDIMRINSPRPNASTTAVELEEPLAHPAGTFPYISLTVSRDSINQPADDLVVYTPELHVGFLREKDKYMPYMALSAYNVYVRFGRFALEATMLDEDGSLPQSVSGLFIPMSYQTSYTAFGSYTRSPKHAFTDSYDADNEVRRERATDALEAAFAALKKVDLDAIARD